MITKGTTRRPEGTKPDPPPAPPRKSGEIKVVELRKRTQASKIELLIKEVALLMGQRACDANAHKQLMAEVDALGRKVECLEGELKSMAGFADNADRNFAEMDRAIKVIAKHVGLRQASGPDTPEAV
ncbi:MAG: hypothetical protein KAJ19_28405 [Gammaproteobacteria bacterium]|nr:hypothetical protein [Gammaproteobacteria bacterium]